MMTNLVEKWKKEEASEFSGWDWSHLEGRKIEGKLPWDYISLAKKLVAKSSSLLDMGTGGGEVLSSFAPFHCRAAATEGYPPNYLLAKRRLEPLGVRVVKSNSKTRKLPFRSGEFDLILNRHDAFSEKEVSRVLKSGGAFLTQQVGNSNMSDLMKFFDTKPKFKVASFSDAKKRLADSGFSIRLARNWKGKTEFKDVGAVVYFLRNAPWVVKGFGVDSHLKYLLKLQKRIDSGKKLVFKEHRYIIRAQKQ